jgi:hypothetical protein
MDMNNEEASILEGSNKNSENKHLEKENIVNLVEKSCIRYKVEVHRYEKAIRGTSVKMQRALLILMNFKTGMNIIHPLSEFLVIMYGNKSIKTQVDYGQKIATFLNYVIDNRRLLKVDSLIDIEYYHASKFLNEYCGALRRQTVLLYKRILSEFYWFLSRKKVLNYCNESDIDITLSKVKDGEAQYKLIAPFPEVELPHEQHSNRNEHDMSHILQSMFLEVAFEEVNIIAFGVACEIFGGLRLSEVVRTRYSTITTIGYYGQHGILINLRDDDYGTRPDLKNNQAKGNVKRPRVQSVLSPFGLVGELFRQHSLKYRAIDDSDAVFVNANGKPMSYESYRYYFNILKSRFIERLMKSDNPILKSQALVLQGSRWSTHICRGIFSNNLIEIVDNVVIAQIQRGDLSSDSIRVYLGNSKKLSEKFEQNAEQTYRNLVEKVGSISR